MSGDAALDAAVAWARRQRDPRRALGTLAASWWPHGAPPPPLAHVDPSPADSPPGVPDDPAAALGAVRAALLPAGARSAGTVYTPAPVARRLVEVALDALVAARSAEPDWRTIRVLDPAVGAGVFLLAAHEALVGRGVAPEEAAGHLRGVDVDPVSAAVAEAAVAFRAGGLPPPGLVRAGDLLTDDDEPGAVGGVDVVIGNPPFRSQLAAATARTRAETERLRERLGPAVVRYLDDAVLFLLDGARRLAPGGVLSLVVPTSVLASSDAAAARAALVEQADLTDLWVADERVFDAAVHVCAPVLVRRRAGGPSDEAPPPVRRWVGPALVGRSARRPPDDTTWATLLADLAGVPAVELDETHGRVGDRARCTAGFRDQYYGLRGAVAEWDGPGDDRPRLVTSGLIDPASSGWGTRPARFDKTRWRAPVVDDAILATSAPEVAAWGAALAAPKLLVATQTRVVEAVADRSGRGWPSVPVIAAVAPADELDHLLAVLLAPPVSAWAFARAAGSGLTPDALRVSASLIASVPLPAPGPAWDAAAALLRDDVSAAATADDEEGWRAGLAEAGRAMCVAYGVDESVADWWTGRLPRPRGLGSLPG